MPSGSLLSPSQFHVRVAGCGRCPSPASAPPSALVSASLLPPPSVCSTRPPSLPPALTATQSPWRLPSAGSSDAHSSSLEPLISSFLTACAGSGSHTPRIPMQARTGGASTAQPCSRGVKDTMSRTLYMGLGNLTPNCDAPPCSARTQAWRFTGLLDAHHPVPAREHDLDRFLPAVVEAAPVELRGRHPAAHDPLSPRPCRPAPCNRPSRSRTSTPSPFRFLDRGRIRLGG